MALSGPLVVRLFEAHGALWSPGGLSYDTAFPRPARMGCRSGGLGDLCSDAERAPSERRGKRRSTRPVRRSWVIWKRPRKKGYRSLAPLIWLISRSRSVEPPAQGDRQGDPCCSPERGFRIDARSRQSSLPSKIGRWRARRGACVFEKSAITAVATAVAAPTHPPTLDRWRRTSSGSPVS